MKPIANVAANFAFILTALALPAAAQVYVDEAGPGVARLSVVSGDVVVRRGDSGEFIAGELNAPLVALDHVLTGPDARAEIQFDWANMIRLAPNTELRIASLEANDRFIQVAEGTVTLSVLREADTPTEISTPTVSVRPLDEGSYRLTVRPDGSTVVTVRSGELELLTLEGSEIVGPRRTMEARQGIGDPDSVLLVRVSNLPEDDWDRWNFARDREFSRSDSYRYVSRDVYGADDLHRYGRWVNDPPYGWVWVPDVGRSWAPYRVGRWSWVNYYGWTWVSSDPWGWAPYHYGRWYHTPAYGWAWYPGGVTVRHYWRPALVSFFGWGSRSGFNFSVSFGTGHIGWVPLAPYEVYRPWYGRGRNTVYVDNSVTVVNNVNIINNYRNARFVDGRTGVTGVDARNFGRIEVNNTNIVQVRSGDLARTAQVRGRVPLEPVAESRRFNDQRIEAAAVVRNERPERGFLRAEPDRQAARRVAAVSPAGPGSSTTAPAAAATPNPVRTIGGRAAEPRPEATIQNSAPVAPTPERAAPAARANAGAVTRGPDTQAATSAARSSDRETSNAPSNPVVVLPRRGQDGAGETANGNAGRGTVSIVGGSGNRSEPGTVRRSTTESASPGVATTAPAARSNPIIDIAPRRGASPNANASSSRPAVSRGRSADALPEVVPSPMPATRPEAANSPAAAPRSNAPSPNAPEARPEVRRSPIPSTRPSVTASPAPAPQPSSPAPSVFRQSPSSRASERAPAPSSSNSGGRSVNVQPRSNPAPAPSPSRGGGVDTRPSAPSAPAPRVESAPSRPAPQGNGNAGGAAPAERGAARRAVPR